MTSKTPRYLDSRRPELFRCSVVVGWPESLRGRFMEPARLLQSGAPEDSPGRAKPLLRGRAAGLGYPE